MEGLINEQMEMQQHNMSSGDGAAAAYNMMMAIGGGGGSSSTLTTYPDAVSQILPWNAAFNPTHFSPDPFLHQFSSRRQQFGSSYDGSSLVQCSSAPFGLHAELQKMSAQEIMDAKALAASKSHSEAERRRRERINNHLAKLRSLLPSTTKTDKASLLAEVIQHVKELKRQTSLIAETSPVPTEMDELTVDDASDEDGKWVIRASICCEDRSDLLPDLIKTLKAMRLKTLKAEITSLGGRVRNVLFVTGDQEQDQHHQLLMNTCTGEDDDEEENDQENNNEHHHHHQYSIRSIEEALRAVMEKSNGDESGTTSVKRQRTNSNINILEYRSF